jgi:hypothetical protein
MPSTVGIVASGVVEFSPLDLNPALWLDAADTATITESGGFVSQWNDKSGNNRNFTQAVGASQPATGTRTQNGLNVLDFDGSNDFMGAGDTLDLLNNNLTVIAVAKIDGTTTNTLLGKYKGVPLAGSWLVLQEGGFQRSYYRDGATAHISQVSYSDTANPYTQLMLLDRVAGTLEQRINGVPSGTTSFTPDSATSRDNATGLWMGALRNSNDNGFIAGYYFDGYVAEVIVTLGILTTAQLASTAAYLNAKWGVTL